MKLSHRSKHSDQGKLGLHLYCGEEPVTWTSGRALKPTQEITRKVGSCGGQEKEKPDGRSNSTINSLKDKEMECVCVCVCVCVCNNMKQLHEPRGILKDAEASM